MDQLCCCCCSSSISSSFWGVAAKRRVHHGRGQQQQYLFVFGNDSKIRKQKLGVGVRAAALEKSESESERRTGGKMMVELVGAFNRLTERMGAPPSRSSSRILFMALKLSLPLLHALPQQQQQPSGRSPLSKALSVALLLADHLRMDAEVISAALLRPAVEAGAISIPQVATHLGTPTAHLLHETFRVSNSTSNLPFILDQDQDQDDDDDDAASALRKFCLTYYDIRAVILELALKLDTMRHLHSLPRYHQQIISLHVIRIHAPLAHAILGSHFLSLELDDLSFRYLFPYSYLYLDTWLRTLNYYSSHSTPLPLPLPLPLLDFYRERLLHSLQADPLLPSMVSRISVKGRYKSRYSTMKKLLRDGRKPEQVHDVLGLRVILHPPCTSDSHQHIEDDRLGLGERACYRAREIIQSLWKEIPHRTKDYIAKPKPNGYRSLHLTVDVTDNDNDHDCSDGSTSGRTRPLMEIQIRTSEMDAFADAGTASHSLYKGGLTDPEEVN